MTQRINLCMECGHPEEEHHNFTPAEIPDGCICDYRDWGNPFDVPAICSGPFVSNEYGTCKHCEHLKECHQ